jgi:hypothetical protein
VGLFCNEAYHAYLSPSHHIIASTSHISLSLSLSLSLSTAYKWHHHIKGFIPMRGISEQSLIICACNNRPIDVDGAGLLGCCSKLQNMHAWKPLHGVYVWLPGPPALCFLFICKGAGRAGRVHSSLSLEIEMANKKGKKKKENLIMDIVLYTCREG